MKAAFLAAAAIALSGCATYPHEISAAQSEILSRYEPTGANVACLSLRRIASMTAVTERVFLFRVGVNDYYLNETASSCAGATSPGVRLEYRTTETQLCASDIVAIVDNSSGITGGSCVLGEFEKLRKKAAKEGAAS